MALVQEDRLLKVDEAAKLLGIAKSTMYLWNQQGIVPNVRIGRTGRGLRFSYRALVEWMGENAANGPWQAR